MQGKPRCSTILEQVKSCGSVSCLVNTEPLELLRLQPSELIASESAVSFTIFHPDYSICFTYIQHPYLFPNPTFLRCFNGFPIHGMAWDDNAIKPVKVTLNLHVSLGRNSSI